VSYRVIWNQRATEAVQRIYDAALDKEGVLNAVTRVGLELAAQPHNAGESRDRGKRVLFKSPLIVMFEIDERMKEVIVVDARPTRH
jgi:hypothetical protein